MLEGQQRLHGTATLLDQLLKNDAGVGELIHGQEPGGLAQFLAQFQARVDPCQDQAQFLGQGGQQALRFNAQHAQRLLNRHARLEQNAQQRDKGRHLAGDLLLPGLGGTGEDALGDQIAHAQAEQGGDPRGVGIGKDQALCHQHHPGQHQRHANLAGSEDRALIGCAPAHAVEQELGFVIHAHRALGQLAAAKLAEQGAETVTAHQLALQALVDQALAAALVQQLAGDQHERSQK